MAKKIDSAAGPRRHQLRKYQSRQRFTFISTQTSASSFDQQKRPLVHGTCTVCTIIRQTLRAGSFSRELHREQNWYREKPFQIPTLLRHPRKLLVARAVATVDHAGDPRQCCISNNSCTVPSSSTCNGKQKCAAAKWLHPTVPCGHLSCIPFSPRQVI